MCAGALVIASAVFSEASSGDLWCERRSWQDLALIAALGPRLSVRDWILTVAVLAFVAVNFFLWSLPISQYQLFLITAPLGFAALIAFTYFAPRQ
jgi:hypothetical protein